MADLISEISNANQYAGNAGIGGAALGHIEIDTKPIQTLAQYTFFYNRAEHEQRQQNADEKIKELADMTAFDPNSAIEKDKPAAIEAYNRIINFTTDYSRQTPKTAKEKVEQEWEFKKRIASTQKLITSINGRAIAYNKRKSEIDADTTLSPAQKKLKLDALNKAAETDVNTPIASEDKFDQIVPDVKAAAPRQVEVSASLGNKIVSKKIDILTSTDMSRQAQAQVTGIESLYSGEHKDFFKAGKNPYDIFHRSAEALNAAIADPKYQKKNNDGTIVMENGAPAIDYEAIQRDNPIVHEVLVRQEAYNKWAAANKAAVESGSISDALGRSYRTISGVTKDDFYTFPKGKPLTGEQLVVLEMFGKSPQVIKTQEDVKYTGEALGYAKLAQDNEQFKLGLGAKSNEDKIGAQSVLSEVADVMKAGKPIIKNYSNNITDTVYEIADANLLKEFGNIDKEGKVTNVPDAVQYNPRTNNVELIYYKRSKGKIETINGQRVQTQSAGDIAMTPSGKRVVDREVPLSATEWMGQIVKRKNPNKDIGGINNIITKVYDAYGRNLQNLAKNYGTETTPNQEAKTGSSSSSATIQTRKGKDGKVYQSTDGVTWTAEDGTQIKLKSK